jgi:hypothetical protein
VRDAVDAVKRREFDGYELIKMMMHDNGIS